MSHRSVVWITMLVCALAASGFPAIAGEEPCAAEINASLDREERDSEQTRLQFTVEVTSATECAAVTYDLIIQERLPNLQWKAVRKSGQVKVRHGKGQQRVEHVMSAELGVLGHKAKIVACEPCG